MSIYTNPVGFNQAEQTSLSNPLATLLTKLNSYFEKGTPTDEEKTEIFRALNDKFNQLKNNPELMSEALYIYGRSIYGKSFKFPGLLLKLSLEWQIAKSTTFNRYSSFAEIASEPFDLEIVLSLLDKIQKPDMALIQTLKWYAFSCQNNPELTPAQKLPHLEQVYGKIKSLCSEMNTKDSIWEIGQVIYNSRPLCGWKKPNDWQAQIDWIREAEGFLAAEGDTKRAAVFKGQLLNMENLLLGKLPETEETFIKRLDLARRAYKISQEATEFDPFLKLNFLNNLARTLHIALNKKKEGIAKDEVQGLYAKLVPQVLAAAHPHEYYSIFLGNAAEFEKECGNHQEALRLLKRAITNAVECGKSDDAIHLLRKASEVSLLMQKPLDAIGHHNEASEIALKTKDLSEVAALLQAAAAIFEKLANS